MLTPEQNTVKKEYRKFLKEELGRTGSMLDNLINAAGKHLPALIKNNFKPTFECLYAQDITIEELLVWSRKLKKDESIVAGPNGFISLEALKNFTSFYAHKNNIDIESIVLPDDDDEDFDYEDDEQFSEGTPSDTQGVRYERSQKARKMCLEKKGYTCCVCEFDFEQWYGEQGKGYIEVHHIIPVSQRGGAYKLNPIKDLVPVCSNCHRMIHRKRDEPLSIQDLKRILRKSHKES